MTGMYRSLAVLCTAFLAVGCSRPGSPTAPAPTTPTPVSVKVETLLISGAVRLNVGERLQLRAVVTKSDGSQEDVTTRASWSSNNSDVAHVSGGEISAVRAGECQVAVA